MSTKRFNLISEAFKSPYACRSILIPIKNNNNLMFDGQTTDYAITAGNYRKISNWDLLNPEKLSYQLNTPLDEKV